MRKILLFTILMSSITITYGQEGQGSITGVVREISGDPVIFSTVALLDQDSSLVKAEITREDGSYTFQKIESGKYRVQINSIQYEPYISEIFELSAGQDLRLKTINVAVTVKELDNVEVTASRPLVDVQTDKTVFNVENSVNSTGNDAMELLRKAPGVVIDNNDNIILQGKNGVNIYIDGKPANLEGEDLVSMLRSMQSDNMESIEIITNPSAKYDAEGNAGIINIKLKRDKNLGLNATLNGGLDVGQQERYRGGINFNYRSKKVNVFGNYGYYDNTNENYENFYKELNDFFLDQKNRRINRTKGNNFRLGSDYYVNDKHTIGFIINGNISQRKGENTSVTPLGIIGTGVVDQVLRADNRDNFETDNINANLNYQYKMSKDASLVIDADYGYYWNNGGLYQPNFYFDPGEEVIEQERIFSDERLTRIDISTVKADYERSIGKGRFSTGFKWSNVESQNNYDFFNLEGSSKIRDINRSNKFNYVEKVTAAYASYFVGLSKKITMSAGLRMEHTESDGKLESEIETQNNRVKRSYTNLFPSGGITYQLNQINKFGLNYSRRIERPSYQDLNPFQFKLDELTFQQGNPFLNPQYTHSFQITHTYKYRLNTQLSYSTTQDFFAQVVDTTGDRGTLLIQRNLADTKNIGINISYPFDVTKWWSVYGNLNVYYAKYDATIEDVRINLDAATYTLFAQNNFLLPKDFKLELSGWYNSPSIWGGTIKVGSMWSMNLGVKKSILKDRGQVNVSVSDLFKTQKWTGKSNYGGLNLDANGGNDSRRLKIGLTYRLGNQQVKASRNRKTGIEEEKSRIKDN